MPNGSTEAAVSAFKRGYQAVAIKDGDKRPTGSAWTRIRWESEDAVRSSFTAWAEAGSHGVGLLLGKPSRGLLDVDIDHPSAWRLREWFLPPSEMQTGRPGNASSHRWYLCRELDDLPTTRKYSMPDGKVSVELRSTGSQTIIPPTRHPSGELYRWEREPWGGSEGPLVVDGRMLSIQVALLALGAVLLDNWPKTGSRHDAYLALAGGVLRYGHHGVHPYWEKNLPVLIRALADVTHDKDGPAARVSEVMDTTLKRLRDPDAKAVGFPRLGELIGVDHAEKARRLVRDIEQLGFRGAPPLADHDSGKPPERGTEEVLNSTLPPEHRNPMQERVNSWAAVDMEPFFAGEVSAPTATILVRDDGQGLMYQGLVNSLFGKSESAKSWLALLAGCQEMDAGGRLMYVDLEDVPEGTLDRLHRFGMADDDLRTQFCYVHPEGPLAEMERYQFRGAQPTKDGEAHQATFAGVKQPDGTYVGGLLDSFDPTLIVVDGMTSLYGLHGHSTNEATATDVIGTWLKRLCRGGKTTVIVIDHTGKAGDSPIGAHHKVAMVQGAAFRVEVISRPIDGDVGEVRLVIYKDRRGDVRKNSPRARTASEEQVAGVATIDSRVPNVTAVSITCPDPKNEVVIDGARLAQLGKAAELQDAFLAALDAAPEWDSNPGWTLLKDVLAEFPDPKPDKNEWQDIWHPLVSQGRLEREGQNRWTRVRRAQTRSE